MKPNRILFAASASLATMLIFSCGNHDHEEPWILSLSSGSVAGLSSSSSVRSSSSRVILSSSSEDENLYSSSEDENLSSSSDGGLVACGLYVACPSSSSSAEETSSSSSLAQCGGKLYIPPDERCENGVIETKCGIGWFVAAANQKCGENDVVMTKCGEDGWYNAANQECGENGVVMTKCGNLLYDKSDVNLRCHNSVIETKCGEDSWYDATDEELKCKSKSGVVKTKCGKGWITLDQFCFEGSGVDKCGLRKEEFDPALYECRDYSKIYLKSKVKDAANKAYEAVLIGKQTWMAENLNYNVSGSKCYNNSASCDIYGRLYDWNAAKNGSTCPSGWHIPSNAEWDELMSAVAGTGIAGAGIAGTLLKAAEHWDATRPYVGTDDYGFSALPGSYGKEEDGDFYFSVKPGSTGNWWSADARNSNNAYYWYIEANDSGMYNPSGSKSLLFSVRCVKD